jgi:hypothetical protein
MSTLALLGSGEMGGTVARLATDAGRPTDAARIQDALDAARR